MQTRHFQLHFLRLMARMLSNLDQAAADERLAEMLEGFPFLAGYRALLAEESPHAERDDWWADQIAACEADYDGHLPLRALRTALDIDADAIHVLLAAGIVEEDVRFGALFAALQSPLLARRPAIGMLGWLLSPPGTGLSDGWDAVRDLLGHGLLVAENRTDPRAEWQLRVPPPIWDAMRGRPVPEPAEGITWQAAEEFPWPGDLILPEKLQVQIARVPDLMAAGQIRALVLRGLAGSGRRTLIGSVARAMSRDVLLCREGALTEETRPIVGALSTLMYAMPVLRCDPAPGETLELARLPGYRGPVGVTLGHSGGLRGELVEQALGLTLPPPDPYARRQFWLATGISTKNGDLDVIAERFLLTGGLIHRAAALGATYTALDDRLALNPADVQQAMRALNRQRLDTLATALEAVEGWQNLIVDSSVMRELLALEVRCRYRELLQTQAGPAFNHTLNRGVRAMFSGPSGTGKTLAARVLAAVLQKDLYRVDLASVVNKYIGETERNLNQVFTHAEALDIILLLDEGDALMARRTEVSTSNDRYANLETNYLLQRMESYQGIVIITTNASQNIDKAFTRRLDVAVEFTTPEAAERRQLWDIHLPPEHDCAPEFLETVAMRCALTGGQIRNAALFATLLALDSDRFVEDQHLETALEREYRKAGASYPLRGRATASNQLARLRRMMPDQE